MKTSAPFKNSDKYGTFWTFKVTPDAGQSWYVDCTSREACQKQAKLMKSQVGSNGDRPAAGWWACVKRNVLSFVTGGTI